MTGMSLHAAASAQGQLMNAIRRVKPTIQQIIQDCHDAEGRSLQPGVDKIVLLCLDADVAYKKNILGRHCGIHPENRGQTGVDAINAQNLTLKITLQGYSETKLENPMGFEKATPGPAASAQENFMLRNFLLADGYLKTIPSRDVEYLPVTCSHTAAALNIVEGGSACKGLHEDISTGGKIDQEKILKMCPSWRKPMQDGIPCIVFRRELEECIPELPEFLSKAGNQSHDVHSKETKVQLMLIMNQLFVSQKHFAASTAVSAPAAPASWDRVVREISTMKPHFKDDAKELSEFAAA